MNPQATIDSTDDEFTGADAEMARRLLTLNRAPRPALLARVRAIPGQAAPVVTRTRRPRLAWVAIAAALLLAGLVLVSPPLRATLGVLGERIGDVYLSITDRLPDTGRVVVHDYTWVTPDQAPFPFGLPQYVPEGWTMDGQIGINHLRAEASDDILVRWTRPDHPHIFMSVYPLSGEPAETLIGANSYREIAINGRPAVIVQGGWDSDTREWGHPDVTTVLWTVGELQYTLWSAGADVPEAELVRMAESVP